MAVDFTTEIENAIEALKTCVIANAGTYLAGIAAAKGDGVALDDFREVEVTVIDPYTQTVIPACLIYPETGTLESLSIGSDTLKLSVTLVAVVNKGTPALLATRMVRYVDAVRQLIRDRATLDGAVDFCRVTGFETYPAPDRVTLGVATIDVEITKEIPNQ